MTSTASVTMNGRATTVTLETVPGSVGAVPGVATATALQPGQTLYSPNLATYPNGTAGYPRAIRVDHDEPPGGCRQQTSPLTAA